MSERQHCLGCCGATKVLAPLWSGDGPKAICETQCPGLPFPDVAAVIAAAQIMRSILLPIFDYVPLTDKMRGEVWSAMKGYDDALDAAQGKET